MQRHGHAHDQCDEAGAYAEHYRAQERVEQIGAAEEARQRVLTAGLHQHAAQRHQEEGAERENAGRDHQQMKQGCPVFHRQLPNAALAQPASIAAFALAAAPTSSGFTCGAGGNLVATSGGNSVPGTEGRTKPSAKIAWPRDDITKLSQSLPASGLGPFLTRL